MNASTTNQLDFPKQVVLMFQNAIEEGTKQGYHMIWSELQKFIAEHPMFVILMLIGFFLLALLNYFTTGRWTMLGSIMYHYLYGGVLYLIAFFFGTDIFTNTWFDIFLFILYIVCFTMVGKVLTKLGIRKSTY